MVRSLAPTMVIAGCLAPALGPVPAAANPVKSLYTTVDLKTCKQVKRHRDGGAWRCDGLGGLPVYVAEGDLRQFVSVGANAEKAPRRHADARRLQLDFREGRQPRHHRVALRSPRRAQTRLRHHRALPHLARRPQRRRAGGVEGVRHRDLPRGLHRRARQPDAIALARQIADKQAKSFDCRQEPHTEGATGQQPDVRRRSRSSGSRRSGCPDSLRGIPARPTWMMMTLITARRSATFSSRSPPILVKALAMGRPPRRQ